MFKQSVLKMACLKANLYLKTLMMRLRSVLLFEDKITKKTIKNTNIQRIFFSKYMQRCLVLFNESIKSPYTRQNYIQHIKKFQKYANITSLDDLAIMPSTNLQTLLEDYLVHLKNTSNANSISGNVFRTASLICYE